MISERVASLRAIVPDGVTIVAVTKGRSISEIKETLAAGITDIGENRVQEAILKRRALSTIDYRPLTIKWHMVGHLQTNKVKDAVRIFDLIQSVDSLRLAQAINKEAAKINKVQDILVEVKVSTEATKYGFDPQAVAEAFKELSKLNNIRVKGLMAIAPIADNPEHARVYFRKIKQLSTIDYRLSTISMGMSEDFRIAIEEGANMVRLGRAIYE